MLADRCNPAQRYRVAATRQGSLPEPFFSGRVPEGLVILSSRRGVWIGGVLSQSDHGHKKREKQQCFHDFPSVPRSVLGLALDASKDRLGDLPA